MKRWKLVITKLKSCTFFLFKPTRDSLDKRAKAHFCKSRDPFHVRRYTARDKGRSYGCRGASAVHQERLRKQHSKPDLEKLKTYLDELAIITLPQSSLMKAIQYALVQWEAIERIFDSGLFELDNNAIERQIRPIAIGRKSYLFAGSHDGARSAAMFYSLFATCKLNGVNVFHWLKDIITRTQSYPASKIDDLLPHNWRALQKTKK